ncbi:MAG: sigma-70 family RNA polymerase sigma factor [Planctomycetota bacterium]
MIQSLFCARRSGTKPPLDYATIHGIAMHVWTCTGRPVSLDATDLAHECILRLTRQARDLTHSRSAQIAYCSTIIRRLVVDDARRRGREPKVARPTMILSSTAAREPNQRAVDLVSLDDALSELAAIDERQASIVELRYFGGLDRAAVAEHLGISVRTLTREWGLARAWLHQKLSRAN